MATLNKTILKKYISALKKEKRKVVTCDMLSSTIGIYPEVIAEFLSQFDPMIRMDFEYNIKDLLPELESTLEELENTQPKVNKTLRVSKKVVESYDSVIQFVYAKMTIGGIVDQSIELSDKDLKILKKIIIKEEQERKKAKRK